MIPAPLQARIDRLGRRAHAFHRFAHHPLCAAYRGEVVALGRWRVCRGCLLAGAGLGVGGGLGWLPLLSPGVTAALLGLWALGLGGLARFRSPSKGLSRFLPALTASALAVQGLRSPWPRGPLAAAWVLGGGLAFIRAYRRRGPHRTPCQACPEREAGGICSGFQAQARRERAFRRQAQALLNRSGR